MDLSDLAAKADPQGRPVVVTLTLDPDDPGHETLLRERTKDVLAAVPKGLRAALEADIEQAGTRAAGAGACAVFVSSALGLDERIDVAGIETGLVVDAGPYIRPVIEATEDTEPFLLVLMDGRRGRVYQVHGEDVARIASDATGALGRHKRGGMSQMRYQRGRQEEVDAYLDDLAEDLRKALEDGPADRVIIAGPGEVKKRFRDRLTAHAKEAVIALLDVDDDEMHAGAERYLLEARADAEAEDVETARRAEALLLSDGLATAGALNCARAAAAGAVDALVVATGARAAGRKDEAVGTLEPADAQTGHDVDLVEEAMEATLAHGGAVHVLGDKDWLAPAGGVAALLRWRVPLHRPVQKA